MSDIQFYLMLAIFGGLISLAKDWKSSSETDYIIGNFFTIIAFCLLILGSWKACIVGQANINDKTISDSTSRAKDSITEIYKDSLISSQQQLLKLEKKQLDTTDEILILSGLLNKRQGELLNNQTGGNSIPLLMPVLRFYALDHESRWHGKQIEEYIDKYILEFKVKNSGNYPISNIRSFRIMSGSELYVDSTSFPAIALGPFEEKELQPTYIIGDKNSSSNFHIIVEVQWSLYSYTCQIDVDTEQDKDSNGNYYFNFLPHISYAYQGNGYKNIKDMEKNILHSLTN